MVIINEANFPDEVFRKHVLEYYGKDGDVNLSNNKKN